MPNPFDDALQSLPSPPPPSAPVPAPPVDPIDAAIDRIANVNDVRLRQSLTQAQSTTPDQALEARRLALKFGVPIAAVQQNIDVYRQREQATPPDPSTLSPALGSWLTDPTHAAVSQGEHEALGQAESATRTATGQGGIVSDLTGAVDTGYRDLTSAAWQLGAVFGVVDPQTAAQHAAEANARAAQLRKAQPVYAQEFATALQAKGAALNQDVTAFEQASGSPIQRALAEFKAGTATVGDVLDMIRAAAVRPRGLLYSAVESLPGTTPMLLGGALGAAAGTAALPGVGTALGFGSGTFAAASPVNIGQAINARLQAKGIDITNPQALARAYADPALMAEVRQYATTKGLTSAAVMGLVSTVAGQVSGLAQESGAITRASAGTADVGVQAAGMGASQAVGEKAVGEKVNVGDAVNTAIATLGFSAAHAGIGAVTHLRSAFHTDPEVAATEVASAAQDALHTAEGVQAIDQVGKAVAQAPHTAQMPEAVKALIETAAGGEDATAVYFQPGEWDRYWTAQGESPAVAAARVMGDDGKAYYEATQTGAPLAVPIGDYVANLATSPHWDGLLEHARLQPDGLTLGEAQTYLQSLPATLTALADEATQPQAPAAPTGADVVADDVEAQLRQAGFSPTEAKTYAAVSRAAFQQLGARAGVDPAALFRSYGIATETGTAPALDTAVPEAQTPRVFGTSPVDTTPAASQSGVRGEATQTTLFQSFHAALNADLADQKLKTLAEALPEGSRAVPFPVLHDYQVGSAMFRAADWSHAEDRAIPIADIVATQKTISEAMVRQKLTESTGLPVALAYQGKYYLADGTHRATAAWARGAETVDARVVPVPDATLADVLQQDAQRGGVSVFNQGSAAQTPARAALAKIRAAGWDVDGFDQETGKWTLTDARVSDRARSTGAESRRTPTRAVQKALDALNALPEGEVTRLINEPDVFNQGGLQPATHDDVRALEAEIKAAHPSLAELHLDLMDNGALRLTTIAVRRGENRQGTGASAMRAITRFADDHGLRIELTLAGRDYGRYEGFQRTESGAALKRFYSRFGFVLNKGETKSAVVDKYSSMYREPSAEFKQGEGAPRGAIQITPDRQITIKLFENRDLSTFLHESGHLYLEVLGDLSDTLKAVDPAALTPDQQGLQADYRTVLQWLGVDDRADIGRAQHEQFARAFEAYLMDGKAPSSALRTAFYRMKQWLVGIYAHVRALDVNLTPDMRRVFDRLLASDAEIAQTERRLQTRPLFDDPTAVGMTDAQAESYGKAVASARQAAEEAVTTRMMRQIRREQSAQWKTWRAPIEAEVTQQIDASPLYKAIAAITDGAEGQPALKLNRAAVRKLMPSAAGQLGRRGFLADDGVHPDVAADVLGFDSGRALVDAMAQAPTRAQAIQLATDQRMQQEHGDQPDEAAIRETATEAVRSEQRVAVLRKELEFLFTQHLGAAKGLLRAVLKPVPPTEEVRRQAATLIEQKTVRALRPDLFNAAATREATAAREAFLRGDVEAAFEAKRRELLLTEVYRAGVAARQEIADALDLFRQLRKPDATIAETRNLDFVQAARAILAGFGLATDRSRERAETHLAHLKEYDPGAYDQIADVIADATANANGSYKDLTVKDIRALTATVDALWTLARESNQFTVNGQRQALADVRRQVLDQIGTFSEPRAKAGYERAATGWDKFKVGLLGARARARRIELWATGIDNGREGIARSAIIDPINDGAIKYDAAREEAAAKYAAIADALDTEQRYHDIPAPELASEDAPNGYTFRDKHRELLGALLHTGNGYEPGSNGYKLLRGRGWGDVQPDGSIDVSRWQAFLDRMAREGVLTKADYDFVQAIWDLNETYKPDAQRTHRARFGRYFDEVTAVPFETPFGRYKGGYFPAIADPFLVPGGTDREDAQAFTEGLTGGAAMFPSVGRGFTKSRTLRYAKPLVMDAAMVLGHLNSVLRFTYLSQPVHDVARLILHPTFKNEMDRFDPAAVSDLLKPYLERAASQRMFLPMQGKLGRAADGAARWMRTRASMQLVAVNLTVLLEQLTHFVSAPAHADVDVLRLIPAVWRMSRQPVALSREIAEASPYMATRSSAGLVPALEAIDRVLLDEHPAKRATGWAQDHATVLLRTVQHAMDLATWQAVYDKVSEEPGMTHERAVKRADTAVREALGSYRPQDRSAIEGGNQIIGLLNMFYGFFNTKLNVLGTEALLASRMTPARKYSRAFALYAMGLMAPAVLGTLIKNAVKGQPLNGEDDEDAAAWAKFWFDSQIEFSQRLVPFLGPAIQTAEVAFTKKEPRDILSAPAITMVQDALHAPGEAYRTLFGDEAPTQALKARAVTDIFTLLGMLTGTPLRPVGQATNLVTQPTAVHRARRPVYRRAR